MGQRIQRDSPKRLKPAGHSATIEALIQPAIVVGSTLMSAIAAYVLALDEITRILNRRGQPSDVFIVVLSAGMGFLIDMAIIVSATRYKMHAIRNDPREERWLQLAKWVLIIGLSSEAMTLFYFFVHLSASAFPSPLVALANVIHALLAISRAFLPPVVLAYFAAGVLPVMFDRADRNREIKSRTSSNIMLLIDRLSEVFDTDDKAEMLRALGGQLMLDTYATYDETQRTTEDEQLRRDAKLLSHLARIHRLDWGAIAADVAPELASPTPTPVAPQAHPQAYPQAYPQAKRQKESQPAESPIERPTERPTERPAERPAPETAPRTSPLPFPQPRPHIPQAPQRREETPALTPAAQATTRRGLGRNAIGRRDSAPTSAQDAPGDPNDDEPADDRADDRKQADRVDLRRRREEAARRIIADDPHITTIALARRIAIATQNSCGETTARSIRATLAKERADERAEGMKRN